MAHGPGAPEEADRRSPERAERHADEWEHNECNQAGGHKPDGQHCRLGECGHIGDPERVPMRRESGAVRLSDRLGGQRDRQDDDGECHKCIDEECDDPADGHADGEPPREGKEPPKGAHGERQHAQSAQNGLDRSEEERPKQDDGGEDRDEDQGTSLGEVSPQSCACGKPQAMVSNAKMGPRLLRSMIAELGLGAGGRRPASQLREVRSPPLRRIQVEPVEMHYFRPRGDEIVDELLLRIGAPIDLCNRP